MNKKIWIMLMVRILAAVAFTTYMTIIGYGMSHLLYWVAMGYGLIVAITSRVLGIEIYKFRNPPIVMGKIVETKMTKHYGDE